jgi:hypothetical protein
MIEPLPNCALDLGERPGCSRTMRLIGRETNPDAPTTELLTFDCDCGQITTAVTNQ